jgi:hypothetical protein
MVLVHEARWQRKAEAAERGERRHSRDGAAAERPERQVSPARLQRSEPDPDVVPAVPLTEAQCPSSYSSLRKRCSLQWLLLNRNVVPLAHASREDASKHSLPAQE